MASKRLWIGFVTVYVATQLMGGLGNFYLFDPIYNSYSHIWRPIEDVKLWILPVTGVFFSFFFVFVFSKGYEGKGVLEGIRYGFYMALMIALPWTYTNYAMMQIPYSLAVQWFTFSLIEYVIAGAILSGIFKLIPGSSSSS